MASILDPFLPYLESRFQAGDSNGHQLWREIKEQGYPGLSSQVSKWMAERTWTFSANASCTMHETTGIGEEPFWGWSPMLSIVSPAQ